MDYQLIFSDNRNSIMLKITYGEVYVHAPSRYNSDKGKKTIADFVNKKEQWIKEKLEKYKISIRNLPDILELKKFYWHGNEIVPSTSDIAKKVSFDGESLVFPSRYIIDNEKFGKQLKKSLSAQAAVELFERLNYFADRYGLRYEHAKIMDSRSLWGVCNAEKEISLNWRLALLNGQLRDYVIIHELCHLQHMNHSTEFWNLMSQYMPTCKSVRKKLQGHDFVMQYLRNFKL